MSSPGVDPSPSPDSLSRLQSPYSTVSEPGHEGMGERRRGSNSSTSRPGRRPRSQSLHEPLLDKATLSLHSFLAEDLYRDPDAVPGLPGSLGPPVRRRTAPGSRLSWPPGGREVPSFLPPSPLPGVKEEEVIGEDGEELIEYEGEMVVLVHRKKANVFDTVLTILKAFLATAVLFVPSGFRNGGLLFSPLVMLVSGLCNITCMVRLIECCQPDRETLAEISQAAFGHWARVAVDLSLLFSQLGYSCASLIFVAQCLQDVLLSLTDCSPTFNGTVVLVTFIWLQLFLCVPTAWVRRLKYLAPSFLLADALIALGLASIAGYAAYHLGSSGTTSSVQLVNRTHWPVFLGFAVYLFEGVPALLPIRHAMEQDDQHKLPTILSKTMWGIVLFEILFGMLAYSAFGAQTNPFILTNLPNVPVTWTLQFLYAMACLLTFPIILWPVTRALEGWLFEGTPFSIARKWRKNLLRTGVVVCGAVVATMGQSDFNSFIAIVGSVCCVPLGLIYPALFHLKLVCLPSYSPGLIAGQDGGTLSGDAPHEKARRMKECWWDKGGVLDLVLMAIGVCVMVFTATMAIRLWRSESPISHCGKLQ
ncbi:unnamed protein product [Vitrella brassicaformis CCMP3155]|uniref:Amino acid transporter transmembrane domain-containing protein n=1 Tax=Vitrella brassicaformis (strain CCMP3155) TaxID=1169540 RepID=A0A0G4FGC8_VITBC|nr:unnamed protein product [Vitrella brassicaformis CCMP3155]|mmetsp:Transcript_45676/g.128986  ORF Transcript_45676/g.128986 Transcript_45676/m.128986 type:complete len:589 (-) Transcript_45676:126-1892(-)|eukprot:CEM11883.1 unnamed protein product [Vitrella brassicaformis CCMP3155]